MLTRLLQFVLQLILRPIPSTAPMHKGAVSPAKSPFDGEPISIEYDGIVLTFGTVEMHDFWTDENSTPSMDGVLDEQTILFRSTDDEADPIYYRDEDGVMRRVHHDRASLATMRLDDIAAEFLSAKSDALAMPDPLEREVIAALRDAYGHELWRRATIYGVDQVEVGGRLYELIPLPLVGHVYLLAID